MTLEVHMENKLSAKRSKCDFWIKEVSFLSHIMSKEGVLVDIAKIEAVVEWKQPKTVTKVRSFLGFAGYYRRFIKDFYVIATPLTGLTKKDKKFVWDARYEIIS